MNIFFIAIGAAVSLLIVIIIASRPAKPTKVYTQMTETEESECVRICKEKARNMRVTVPSEGVKITSFYKKIHSAYRMVCKKVKEKTDLSEAEKWLYENFRLVYKATFAQKEDLKGLPGIDGTPRIVLLAEYIVEHSLRSLNTYRIKKVMDEIKWELPLEFEELMRFPFALRYVLMKELYILAERLLFIERCRVKAKKDKINCSMVKYNSYLYHWIRIHDYNEELKRLGANEKKIIESNTETLFCNTLMAQTVFNALRNDKELFTPREGIGYLRSYEVIKECLDVKYDRLSTLITYFKKISHAAKKCKVSEEYAGTVLKDCCEKNSLGIAEILYDHFPEYLRAIRTGGLNFSRKKKDCKAIVFIATTLLFTIATCVASYFVFSSVVVPVLVFVPIYFNVEKILTFLFSFIFRKEELPVRKLDSVPSEHATSVVFSAYIGSVEELKKFIFHAESTLDVNRDKYINCILLVDTPASNEPISDIDRELKKYFSENVSRTDIALFLRKKTLNGKKYSGKERKRGALLALSRYFMGKKSDEFFYISTENLFTPTYFVALDTDSVVMPGGIKEMIERISHPYAKKYGIVSAVSKCNLYSFHSLYSHRFLRESGFEEYPIYTGAYQRLFGKDVFCGKGIIRVKDYYYKLYGLFPAGKILSHDIPEGAVLGCASGGTTFENVPNDFISDVRRNDRWKRGDVQNLPFLHGRWKDEEGKRVKYKFDPFYRFILAKNILTLFTDPCIVALLIIGGMVSARYLVPALCVLALPFVTDIVFAVRNVVFGKSLRYIAHCICEAFFSYVEDIFLSFYHAIKDLLLVITTLLKMIFSKNLLEWKTFSSFGRSNFSAYIREFVPSLFVGTVVLLLALFFGKMVFFYYFAGYLICLLFVFLSLYFCSETVNEKWKPNDKEREKLLIYARATYCYFTSQDGLIPDNVQLRPYKVANYTSITDIGFSLLAHISAIELGLIGEEEGRRKIAETIRIVENLPKWYGICYNWYDVNSLTPTNGFVSSVDAGNFFVALLIVSAYFHDKDFELSARAEKLLKQQDLRKLYDAQKERFFIGFDGVYTGHYDMLCSESRILSMVFMALYGKPEHYYSLIKEYSPIGGNTLLSWGGTAFEALLAELFFPTPEHSLLYQTAYNNAVCQSKNSFGKLWGVSESGYYAFDDEMRYQYKSFGLNSLSVAADTNEAVVSPYSSFLCMGFLPHKSLKNLIKAEEMGLFSEYGFYESMDMQEGKRIVSQVMAHHQGMILCAIANVLCDDLMRKLVFTVPAAVGVSTLFNERPTQKSIRAYKKEKSVSLPGSKNSYFRTIENPNKNPISACFTDGFSSVVFNGNGSMFMHCGDIYLQKRSTDYHDPHGCFFYVKKDNGWISPSFLLIKKGDCTFYHTEKEAIYSLQGENICQYGCLLPGMDGFIVKLSCAPGTQIAFYSDIVLNRLDAYLSHPTFSDMFVRSEFLPSGIVLFTRSGKNKKYVAVRVAGCNNLKFETNRMNFIGRGRSLRNPKMEQGTCGPSFGDVLTPCFSFTAETGKRDCQVCMMYSENREELISTISSLPSDVYLYAVQSENLNPLKRKTQELLSGILYGKRIMNSDKNQISDDRKEIYCRADNKKDLYEYLTVYEEMRLMGLKTVLVFRREDMDSSLKKECERRHIQYKSADLPENDYCIDMPCEQPEILFDDGSEISSRDLQFMTGRGGFDSASEYYITSFDAPELPYTHIIAGEEGGSLITSTGGGFFWFGNSRENKINRFDNDPVSDLPTEYLSTDFECGKYFLLGGHGKNRYSVLSKGCFTHVAQIEGVNFRTSITAMFDGRVRMIEIKIGPTYGKECFLHYSFIPCLDSVFDAKACLSEQYEGGLVVKNSKNGRMVYLKAFGAETVVDTKSFDPSFCVKIDKESRIFIAFGCDKELMQSLNENNIPLYCDSFLRKCRDVSGVEVVGGSLAFEKIVSWLPYQIYASRLSARAGFYQVGGAFGFRDQLQDAMAFSSRPDILKKQILLCCAHQYEEGDVQHWWHPDKYGLRTRITDDKLFLPLAVCRYISVSDDTEILNFEVNFLSSPPLGANERDRFEHPEEGVKATVFKHCLAAIRSALKYGEHRLLIMGTGDWNDGMDTVCEKGSGESVFNSMLAYYVLTEFSAFCPDDLKKELLNIATDLKTAVNTFAFDRNRYLRLFTDDGTSLGGRDNKVLELDLLVQAVAVLSGVADGERADIALRTCEKLIDRENGLIKLLSPPQTTENRIGYISDYPPGVRENGGQYTHAAMWYLIALCRVGRQDEAYDLFCMLNPAEKCSTEEGAKKYKGEPYVFAGDVYSNPDNPGRCGWSWYTGSAAWAYRLVTEEFFGLIRQGTKLYIKPKLPKKLDGSTVTYRFGSGVFLIEYRLGLRDRILVDGVKSEYVELKDGCNCLVSVEIGL